MDLEGLNQWLAERNLKGHWDHQQWSQTVRTHLWKGKDIFEGLNRAGELITTGETGRRTIQMRNPGFRGDDQYDSYLGAVGESGRSRRRASPHGGCDPINPQG